jgi:hypothetical protein
VLARQEACQSVRGYSPNPILARLWAAVSGPPPITESSSKFTESRSCGSDMLTGTAHLLACRQCGKDFNPLWRRSHPCGHCGYEYCSACLSDGQALMPRRPSDPSSSSSSGVGGAFSAIKEELGIGGERRTGSGYEVESVCLACLSMLQGRYSCLGTQLFS